MIYSLKNHLVRGLAVSQSKVRSQIVDHMRNFFSSGDDGSINGFLVFFSLGRSRVDGLLLLEDFTLVLLILSVQFDSSKVFVVNSFGDGDGAQFEFGGSGQDVFLVNSSEWDTVDLEGSGNQKQTALQLFQENSPLTSVSAGNQNNDGAWNQTGLQFGGTLVVFANTNRLLSSSDIVGGIRLLRSAFGWFFDILFLFGSGSPSSFFVDDFFGIQGRSGVFGNGSVDHFSFCLDTESVSST